MISQFQKSNTQERNFFFYFKLFSSFELLLFNALVTFVVWYTNNSELSASHLSLNSGIAYTEQTGVQFFFHASNDYDYYWIILIFIAIVLMFCVVFIFKNLSLLLDQSFLIRLSVYFACFFLYCTLISFWFFFLVSFSSNFLCDPLIRTYDSTITFHETPLDLKMAPRSVLNEMFLPPFYSETEPQHHTTCVYNTNMSSQSRVEFTILLWSSSFASFAVSLLVYFFPYSHNHIQSVHFYLNIAIKEYLLFLILSSSSFMLYNAVNWDWNVFVWIITFFLIIIFKSINITLFLQSKWHTKCSISFSCLLSSLWIYYKLFHDIEAFLENILTFF